MHQRTRTLALAFFAAALATGGAAAQSSPTYEISATSGLPQAWIEDRLAKAQPAPQPQPVSDQYFYSGSDGRTKVSLVEEPSLLAVQFDEKATPRQIRSAIGRIPYVHADAARDAIIGARNFTWVAMAAGTTTAQARQAASTLQASSIVITASPGLVAVRGQIYGLNQEIIAAFQPSQTPLDVENILDAYGLTVVQELDTAIYTYVLKVPTGSGYTASSMANHLINTYGSGVIDYAHPNFVAPKITHLIPNDPLFNRQWHLDATNVHPQFQVKPDADIDGPEAWDVETGAGDGIIIAVVDTGIDLAHPDLDLVPGADVASGSGSPGYQYTFERHSTAVSGMAAALGNNALGVSGICQGCKVMPIRFLAPGATLGDEAQAFNFARIHGADVINNSWGPTGNYQPNLPASTLAAIDKAVDEGRNGLGIPIFFASGNSGGAVPNNGYVNHPKTIAVGASTNQDVHANYSSQSASLNFVAPSGDGSASGGVWTTDMTGILGYSTSGDYTGGLAGTSFASPLAAGTAALMIAANPALTWDQIRDVMEETAEEIDPSHSSWSGGFSNYYGHGKINAHTAVMEALETSGPTPGDINKTYDWPNGGSVNLLPGYTTSSSMQVMDAGTIRSLKLNLTNNHPDPTALEIKLRHPDGTWVTLWDETPGPIPGQFEVPTFVGKPLAGHYQLRVHVQSSSVAGSISGISMTVTYTPPPPPPPTFTSGYPPQPIPDADPQGLTQLTWISESGTIESITFNVQATHPDVGDLRITVVAPDSSSVVVHNQNMPGTSNLNLTVPLSGLVGKNLHGSWKVIAQDLVAGTTGTLDDWTFTIAFTPDGCAPWDQWNSVDVPKAVPDNDPSGVTSDLDLNVVGTINNTAGIYVHLTHPNVGNDKITLSLIHPDGVEEVICGQITPFFFNTCPYGPNGIQATFTRDGSLGKPMDGTWQLRVRDEQAGFTGTLQAWRLDLSYLPSGCGEINTYLYDSVDVPQTIPNQDFAGVRSDIPVDGSVITGILSDVNVSVDIAHTGIGDLRVYLVSPDGTYALLHNETGGHTDDLVTTFDTFTQPFHPLSIFNGKDPDGIWQLWVVDEGNKGTGSIQDWGLEITTITP